MDCFSSKERAAQQNFALLRDRFFSPVVKLTIRLRLSPNFVTVLGVIFLVLACVSPPRMSYVVALFLLLYVIMDGIDGPLARKLGRAHEGGSLVDICADQLGVILIPAAAIFHISTSGIASTLFASAHVTFIALVTYNNSISAGFDRKFLRIKYPIYGLYVFSLYQQSDYLTVVLYVAAAYYAAESIIVLNRIYTYFDDKHNS